MRISSCGQIPQASDLSFSATHENFRDDLFTVYCDLVEQAECGGHSIEIQCIDDASDGRRSEVLRADVGGEGDQCV